MFLCLKIHQAKAGARQPLRGECSAGSVFLSFLKCTLSRQRGAQQDKTPLCTKGKSDIGSGIAPKPLQCVLYIRRHFMSPQNKLSLVPRLGFIAGGAHSNVSGRVCLTMSITLLFDYNVAKAWLLAFTFFMLCVSSLFSFWKLSREGFSCWEEQGWGTAPRTSDHIAFQQAPWHRSVQPDCVRVKLCANVSIFIGCS